MKINEKNLAAFASSGSQVDREGYLMKKADGSKGYSKRWFVLKGNLLFYFEKKSDRDPLGVIILEGSTIELAESEMEEYFCFKIVFPSRVYLLSAESQDVMEQWMKALACASYDYIKLMASELQRQLNELGKPPGLQSNATSGAGCLHHVRSHDSIKSMDSSSTHQHIPTPPPRSKNIKNIRGGEKKSFEILHKEFGAKILRDQEARWSLSRDNQVRKKSAQAQLSVLKQNSLIDL